MSNFNVKKVLDSFGFSKNESKAYDKKNQEANQELVIILKDIVDNHPEQRFGQILRNYGFIKEERPANPDQRISWQNDFFTETKEILKRVKQYVKNSKK